MTGYIIVGLAGLSTILSAIIPSYIYLRLGPVNQDFGDVAIFGKYSPNAIFGVVIIVFGVGSFCFSVTSGVMLVS